VLLLQDLSTCEQSGRDLAVQVKRRLKTKEQGSMGSMAAVTASGPQLAMGRVVGSLCVVTAKDEDYATGMIASWVSQVRQGQIHVAGLCVGWWFQQLSLLQAIGCVCQQPVNGRLSGVRVVPTESHTLIEQQETHCLLPAPLPCCWFFGCLLCAAGLV
jgi:hypothetical protein